MDKNTLFETLTIKETIDLFETNEDKGLSNEVANQRLLEFGENKFEEKKKDSFLKIFFRELNDPMIFILLGAVVLTLIVSIYDTIQYLNAGNKFNFLESGDWADIIIILAVIILNGMIGAIQEMKANNALDALKKMSSPEANVIRDGQIVRIKSKDLVVGDVVVLEEGDTVGADIRLIQSASLKADESSLTGESMQVEKDANNLFDKEMPVGDRTNIVYMSTPITCGRGKGVVIKTGMNTEIGKIAKELATQEDETTPLQKALAKLSKVLGILTIGIVILVFLVELFWIIVEGKGTQIESYLEALLSSISLAVAAIPEGLAAVVAIVLSIGVQRMVKANTIVRKLPSVETLGSVRIVCSDKTGTLTQNKMTVVEAYVPNHLVLGADFNENKPLLELLAKGMSLCSNAEVDNGVYGDPTEIALVNFANDFNMHKGDLQNENPRVNELPFDSVRKMMSTLHQNGVCYTKGALDSILKHTTRILVEGEIRKITNEDIDSIYEKNTYFSGKALRVLALAYQDDNELKEDNLIFVGLVAMVDPPRKESKDSVAKLKSAGITTVMITGDHKDTAFAIAKELGICDDPTQCLTGHDVDMLSEEELKQACLTVRVFARVSPENKVSIVRAFKANGNICAMTGDGVNDAPSLKSADIGIAMGITGTDVAKNAADMVLTDDNFASIEKAVEEGRGIYKNIKKTIIFLLSSNISEVLTMLLLILVGLPLPLIAIHLLWVNLITDSLPAIALGMDPKPADIMNEKPRDPNEGVFANGGFKKIIGYGAVITLAVVLAYLSVGFMNGCYSISAIKNLYESNESMLRMAQTMSFVTLAFSELLHMLGMSDTNNFVFKVFKNKNFVMYLAFIVGALLQILVCQIGPVSAFFKTSQLDMKYWLICILCAFMPLVVHEVVVLIKIFSRK